MADARDTLPAYINTFDPAKGYQRMVAHYDRFLTSNELNVIQDIEANRLKGVADAFWRDGSLVSGGAIVLGPDHQRQSRGEVGGGQGLHSRGGA
ncbi:hypothetical protein ABIF75_001175 [Bradyrhizobium japonicum]